MVDDEIEDNQMAVAYISPPTNDKCKMVNSSKSRSYYNNLLIALSMSEIKSTSLKLPTDGGFYSNQQMIVSNFNIEENSQSMGSKRSYQDLVAVLGNSSLYLFDTNKIAKDIYTPAVQAFVEIITSEDENEGEHY